MRLQHHALTFTDEWHPTGTSSCWSHTRLDWACLPSSNGIETKNPKRVLQQEKYCQMPFFGASSTTWQLKQISARAASLEVSPPDLFSKTALVAKLPKKNQRLFFPLRSTRSNPSCSIVQARFIWKENVYVLWKIFSISTSIQINTWQRQGCK